MAMSIIRDDCVFCSAACEDISTYRDITAPHFTYLLGVIDDFRILVDAAPLTAGHILLIPHEHVESFALLPPKRLQQASDLIHAIEKLYGQYFQSDTFAFEHGTGLCGREDDCCLDHAHIHLLPGSIDTQSVITSLGQQSFDELAEVSDLGSVGAGEYLLLRSLSNQTGDHQTVVYRGNPLPSQFLRKMCGQQLQAPMWNWQDTILLEESETILGAVQTSYHESKQALSPLLSRVVEENVDHQ